jgi:hypothetical protein
MHEVVNSTCRHRGFCKTIFFHNRLKNDAQDLKNGIERRVPRFCTICDKYQPLNEKNEKVMAILGPKICTRIFFFVCAIFRHPPVTFYPHDPPL